LQQIGVFIIYTNTREVELEPKKEKESTKESIVEDDRYQNFKSNILNRLYFESLTFNIIFIRLNVALPHGPTSVWKPLVPTIEMVDVTLIEKDSKVEKI